MQNFKIDYRPEIDGLRALAVFSVIFYHSEIVLFDKNFFQGGFLGVDIFFVIS
jgi:peptidoglycan/LPS O-acetylase OafA/YrhL